MSANDSTKRGRRIGRPKCGFFTSRARAPQTNPAVRGSLQRTAEEFLRNRFMRATYAASSSISSFADSATAVVLVDAGILVDFIAASAVAIPYSIAG